MSLEDLTSRDSVTIKRLVVTQGSAGGQVRTFTTAARGSLVTSWTCRTQPMTAEERLEYGVKGARKSWKHLGTSDPSSGVQDVFVFTDEDDVSRNAGVISPSRNLDGQDRLWMVVTEELSTQ
jgi:hypothetical protein